MMKNPYFSLIRNVWRYGAKWHREICGYYLAYILAQTSLSLSPYAFGRAINLLQNFHSERLQELIYWLAFGIIVVLLFWLFHGPARYMERTVALKIQQSFRLNLYEQLTHLPLKWHQDHHSGNTITRLNRSSASLYRFAENQYLYTECIVRFIVSIGFLLWISLPIGLISLLFSLFVVIPMVLFDRQLISLYDAENEVENHVGGVLFDYISNMTTILTLRLGDLTRSNLWVRMMSIWPFFRKEAILNETKWFFMMMSLSIIQALILIGYIIHSLNGTKTIILGYVVMIFRYQAELTSVFQELSIHLGEIVRMDTDVRSIQPILDDIDRLAHLPLGASTASQWHTIQIENLAFHHDPGTGRRQIFSQIDFQIKRGEKLALIGHSGGGKSTLLNLLGGLYTPSSVNLTIDGISFNTLEPLQAITTLIPQDPEIFENTIAFNITLDLPANEEAIQHAVSLAGFLMFLPRCLKAWRPTFVKKGLIYPQGKNSGLL